MKIGILTHHYVSNYGAFLQAYALREAVAKAYPNDTVEIINLINVKQFVINACGWFRFYRDRENIRCWLQKVRIPLMFARARRRDMLLSPLCFTARKVNQQDYDVILIGSDEVWNFQDWKSYHPIKFGQGLKCKHIVAYAPSVGNSEGDIPQYAVDGIKQFVRISVRDQKTSDLVESITEKKAKRVLDPTFLADFPNARRLTGEKPYILFYYCDHLPVKIRDQIFQYAHAHGMEVYGAGECDKHYNAITANIQPFEWVEMFRNASFVFTGTFHGVVFSILNEKPFKVYLTNKSRIHKVNSLLEIYGLDHRQIDEDFVFDLERMKNEIDYKELKWTLDREKEASMDYLCEAVDAARKS